MNTNFFRCAIYVGAGLCSSIAMAQSNVTLYGRLDTAVESVSFSGGAKGSRSLTMLSNDGSRFGFRGLEDMGSGWRTTFRLENGFSPTTGTLSTANVLFNREAVIGIGSSSFGDLYLGRNYSPMDDDAWSLDSFKYASNAATYAVQKYKARIDSSIKYLSPDLGGARIGLLYGGLAENTSTVSNRISALNVTYTQGPLVAKAAFQQSTIAGSTANIALARRDVYAGGSYDFKVAKLSVVYYGQKDEGTDGYSSINTGLNIPMGVGDLRAGYTNVKQGSKQSNLIAVGYWHPLSTRTTLYTTYARTSNGEKSNLIGYVLPAYTAIDTSEKVNAFQVGIRHNF